MQSTQDMFGPYYRPDVAQEEFYKIEALKKQNNLATMQLEDYAAKRQAEMASGSSLADSIVANGDSALDPATAQANAAPGASQLSPTVPPVIQSTNAFTQTLPPKAPIAPQANTASAAPVSSTGPADQSALGTGVVTQTSNLSPAMPVVQSPAEQAKNELTTAQGDAKAAQQKINVISYTGQMEQLRKVMATTDNPAVKAQYAEMYKGLAQKRKAEAIPYLSRGLEKAQDEGNQGEVDRIAAELKKVGVNVPPIRVVKPGLSELEVPMSDEWKKHLSTHGVDPDMVKAFVNGTKYKIQMFKGGGVNKVEEVEAKGTADAQYLQLLESLYGKAKASKMYADYQLKKAAMRPEAAAAVAAPKDQMTIYNKTTFRTANIPKNQQVPTGWDMVDKDTPRRIKNRIAAKQLGQASPAAADKENLPTADSIRKEWAGKDTAENIEKYIKQRIEAGLLRE